MSTKQVPITSGLATFLPRARLLRLIGSELISDDIVAITELVKNAHDADASFISLQFTNVTGDDGEIVIRDDGFGMDQTTLLTRWMQPAGSAKGRESTRFTPSGRRVLGEKGVGRFSTDKLGARLELVSRRPNDSSEVHAVFDWDEFDADDLMLSDVKSHWEVRPADWLDSHGTMLRLTRLRARWTERMFRRLCTRLARLVSPFQAQAGFRINIQSDEFPSYSGDVNSGYLPQAPHRIEAEFDGTSTMSVRIGDGKPTRISLGIDQRLSCGPVRFRLFAFDLETQSLARLGPRAEVRAWLREWSGISVYRDGFRIWPYGEPHDDWLRLDQRRVNNPVVRLSNNQVVGFVEISSDRNPELRDQTNREGLIHNIALTDLQTFILHVMQLLEAERQATRHPQSRKVSSSSSSARIAKNDSVADQIEQLATRTKGDLAGDLKRIAERSRKAEATEQQSRRKMLEGFTEMAAVGQSSMLVCHSLSSCLDLMRELTDTLRGSFKKKDFDKILQSGTALMALETTLSDATEHLRSVTSIKGTAGRRRRGIDVVTELRRIADTSKPMLDAREASIVVSAPRNVVPRTEMRPELFDAVICAMVMNSIEWSQPKRPLRVSVRVRVDDEHVEMIMTDNGRGITPGLEEVLFEPLVSGRDDAGGMGLTVARNIVEMHGGKMELVSSKRGAGATFAIRLPQKKARATTPA